MINNQTDDIESRYSRDVQFRALVDTMHSMIRQAQYTPTEIREAALLAAIHYDRYTIRTSFMAPDGVRP